MESGSGNYEDIKLNGEGGELAGDGRFVDVGADADAKTGEQFGDRKSVV